MDSQRAVNVQPFPATGATYQLPVVEQGGYCHPLWSPDGKELFYVIGGEVSGSGRWHSHERLHVRQNPSPHRGSGKDSVDDVTRPYDILPDGQRLIAEPLPQAPSLGRPTLVGRHTDSRCVELVRRTEAARPGAIARLWAPGRLAQKWHIVVFAHAGHGDAASRAHPHPLSVHDAVRPGPRRRARCQQWIPLKCKGIGDARGLRDSGLGGQDYAGTMSVFEKSSPTKSRVSPATDGAGVSEAIAEVQSGDMPSAAEPLERVDRCAPFRFAEGHDGNRQLLH